MTLVHMANIRLITREHTQCTREHLDDMSERLPEDLRGHTREATSEYMAEYMV